MDGRKMNKKNKAGNAADSRRNFLKQALKIVPSVGACCFIPGIASGAQTKKGQWFCISGEIFLDGSNSYYFIENCHTGEIDIIIDVPGLPAGNCLLPSAPSCFLEEELAGWERSRDFFRVAFSPRIPKHQHAELAKSNSKILAKVA